MEKRIKFHFKNKIFLKAGRELISFREDQESTRNTREKKINKIWVLRKVLKILLTCLSLCILDAAITKRFNNFLTHMAGFILAVKSNLRGSTSNISALSTN